MKKINIVAIALGIVVILFMVIEYMTYPFEVSVGIKLIIFLIIGFDSLMFYYNIRGEKNYKQNIIVAVVVSIVFTIVVFFINNLIHLMKFQYIFGDKNSIGLWYFMKEDANYSIGIGSLRYLACFIGMLILCILLPLIKNQIDNFLNTLLNDEEIIEREKARRQFLESSTFVGIGGFGSKILNHILELEPEARCVIIYENDTKNISLLRDNIKVGINGFGVNNARELERLLKETMQAFIITDLGSKVGSMITVPVAKAIYDSNIYSEVVSVVPFSFEGKELSKRADEVIMDLFKPGICDALYSVKKDRLIDHCPDEMTSAEGFYLLTKTILDHVLEGYKRKYVFDK